MYVESHGFDSLSDIEKHDKEKKGLIHEFFPIIPINKDLLVPSEQLVMTHNTYEYDQRFEKMLALRTELLMRRETEETAFMIAVMSPCAGEGRSQLAAELAISFAKLSRPTLLIDADFRKPRQHVLFGAENSGGLSQVIEADETPDFHGVMDLEHLLLMTTGEIPENPLELLSDSKFSRTIEFLQENFEFVIFDTPPVDKFADGLVIANLVRNVLTVNRAKHTPYRQTRDMLRRLSTTNSQLLGGVINHF